MFERRDLERLSDGIPAGGRLAQGTVRLEHQRQRHRFAKVGVDFRERGALCAGLRQFLDETQASPGAPRRRHHRRVPPCGGAFIERFGRQLSVGTVLATAAARQMLSRVETRRPLRLVIPPTARRGSMPPHTDWHDGPTLDKNGAWVRIRDMSPAKPLPSTS